MLSWWQLTIATTKKPMNFKVESVNWQQAETDLRSVREKVFVYEWRIPPHIEFDKKDKHAFHVLVTDDNKDPVATGRLLLTGEISRVAVTIPARGSCACKLVFDKLKEIALKMDLDEVFINSSLEAVSYFKKHQFSPIGAVFMEAGIPRQRMTCPINKLDLDQYNHWH